MSNVKPSEKAAQFRRLYKSKMLNMAIQMGEECLEEDPKNDQVRFGLATCYFESADYHTALDLIEDLLSRSPDESRYLYQAAHCSMRSGHREEAIEYALRHEKVVDHENSLTLFADIYERNGMLEEARECASRMEALPSLRRPIYLEFLKNRILLQEKQYGEAIDGILNAIKLYESTDVKESSEKLLPELNFSLAKAYDRSGEYDKAWAAAESAHRAAGYPQWDAKGYDARNMDMIELMTPEFIDALPVASRTSECAVLIVGNPRSGTSLMEQILSMHPQVSNAGELSVSVNMQQKLQYMTDTFLSWPESMIDMRQDDIDVLADMYADATRRAAVSGGTHISNKVLTLQYQLGFLSRVLPNAKAVNLRRHPLDNCVSCFTTNIAGSGHHYAGDIENLGKAWISRRKLQDYWPTVLDLPILELHYENLVANQEAETRRLLDFLEVPWNDDCLQFHKSTRVAATISYDQVNQKMYSSSSGRWKRYEKHLGPLIDILEDYL